MVDITCRKSFRAVLSQMMRLNTEKDKKKTRNPRKVVFRKWLKLFSTKKESSRAEFKSR